MRDRLIELINNYPCMSTAEDCFIESISSDLADYLLANSVIVPPCKIDGEVCHCPDCIYCEMGSTGFHLCKRFGGHVTDYDYCSHFTRTPKERGV